MSFKFWGAFAVSRFERQFEPDGDGYVYRRNMKGAAMPVSVTERDVFIAQFRRWHRWRLVLEPLLSMGGFIMTATIAYARTGAMPVEALIVTFLIATFALSIGLQHWIWNAPRRALKGRAAVAAPRAEIEVLELRLRAMSWWRLVPPFGFALLLITAGVYYWAVPSGEDPADYFPLGVLMGAAVAAVAYWKRCLETAATRDRKGQG